MNVKIKQLAACGAVALAMLCGVPSQATTRYVKAGATGSGQSWTDASGNLQAMIEASSAGDEVWIAAGTYRPDSLIKSNKRTSRAFFLKDGVALIGGFEGNEASKDERARSEEAYQYVNATILDGDDDEPDVWERAIADGTTYRYAWRTESDQIPGTSGNASHVLYAANELTQVTIVDGVTLKGGNANVWNSPVYARGGAVYARGNLQLLRCRVIENSGYFKPESTSDSNTYGGAVCLIGGDQARIDSCLFDRNYCHSGYGSGQGGAIYAQNVTITASRFVDCVTLDNGGAIFLNGGSVTDCYFKDCYGASGGAVYVNKGTVDGCVINECRGLQGGGAYNKGTFTHNWIFNCYADAPEYGDSMGGQGGAIYNVDEGLVMGCVAYNNTSYAGGGVYVKGGHVVNSTLVHNALRTAGAEDANIGLADDLTADNVVINTIWQANTDMANFNKPSAFEGTATTAADTAALALDQVDWCLAKGSTLIDAGTLHDTYVEQTDIMGNDRVMGESIDVGAIEAPATPAAAIVLTYDEAGKYVRIGTGGSSGVEYSIDWGDGELKTYTSASYITDSLRSNTVKIYGDVLILAATNQGLTECDLSGAPNLSRVQVGDNKLTSLNVTNNTALTGLYAENNQLEHLDVSSLTALRVLDVHNNQITGTIDCSAMGNLSKVDVADNKLDALILPHHSTLYQIECSNNENITSLDLSGLTGLDQLSCNYCSLTELNCSSLTAVTEIYAQGNRIASVDLSACTALKTLNMADNLLSSIDLSKNTALEGLYLYNNTISTLDLTANSNTRWINVNNNGMTSLKLNSSAPVSLLYASYNQLTTIDVPTYSYLSQLHLDHNLLTNVNVTSNSYLSWLKVDNNYLTELDVTHNSYLYWLECDSNRISTLDISKCTYLQRLAAEYNQLTTLDVSNNSGLQGLSIQGNNMDLATINTIIDQLPDVNNVEPTDQNSSWCRILNISNMPGTKGANVDVAQSKGWYVIADFVDGIADASVSVSPVSTTYINVNGMVSDQPFNGVNVVVTRYSDGTRQVTKVVK